MPQKDISKLIQANERKILSKYATFSENSRGRSIFEVECSLRGVFQRDRDRIIHSRAFRQLKYKTQVFLLPLDESLRTRLTHTIEVAQIARTIARALSLNEDLTEAIALGHDLGHPPFGHAGEEALSEVSTRGFKHYQQSLRVVDVLERGGRGLNLTHEVREGILYHSHGALPLRELGGLNSSTLEARVVWFADNIAYINHDIDDAIAAGILTPSDLPKSALECLGKSHGERIESMIVGIVEESQGKNTVSMSENVVFAAQVLRDYLYNEVYQHPRIREGTQRARTLIIALFERLMKEPERALQAFPYLVDKEPLECIVIDYIWQLSDYEAISLYNELFLPRAWIREKL